MFFFVSLIDDLQPLKVYTPEIIVRKISGFKYTFLFHKADILHCCSVIKMKNMFTWNL